MSTTVISTPLPGKAPAWATTMRRWTDYIVKDFGGGPRRPQNVGTAALFRRISPQFEDQFKYLRESKSPSTRFHPARTGKQAKRPSAEGSYAKENI